MKSVVVFKEKREAIKLHYNKWVGLRENKLLINMRKGRKGEDISG